MKIRDAMKKIACNGFMQDKKTNMIRKLVKGMGNGLIKKNNLSWYGYRTLNSLTNWNYI